MPSEGTPAERCTIPEGAVIIGEVELIMYLEEGGEQNFGMRVNGEGMPYSSIFGLIEMGKQNLIDEWRGESG